LCLAAPARADSTNDFLRAKATAVSAENHANGWAYVISGTVSLGVSVPGYFLSEDVFAKAVYSITETLGAASVGYGAYLLLVDDDFTRFERILARAELTPEERNRLARRFLEENADRARNVRKIRVISHSLTAGLNFLNAATSSQRDLSTALYFVGGINTLAAITFAFRKSEEEKLTELSEPRAELLIGPGVALAIHF
jgi:hypothetical protein